MWKVKSVTRLLVLLGVLVVVKPSVAITSSSYSIYLDADFTGTKVSSISIQQGIQTALSEINNKAQGIGLNLVIKDHRGNSLRSRKNLETFLSDENALVMFSGLHSPPLLANKSFINNKKILLLDPWAAAGPITRSTDNENWIFRLSIDDSKAGEFITKQALAEGFKRPFLLLEDTGWGRSNERTMVESLSKRNIKPSGIDWFNWGIGLNHAKLMLRNIVDAGADVIFFVGNAPEGKVFANAMIELLSEVNLPIRSHWGITGGDFVNEVGIEKLNKLNLQFIQTKFSFLNPSLLTNQKMVLTKALGLHTELRSKHDIKAQTGFVHAYDLTKLLIAAIEQVKLTGNKAEDSKAIHRALENLNKPVNGLLKTYHKPFSPYTSDKLDAHEALTPNDYSMGYFNKNGEVNLLQKQ